MYLMRTESPNYGQLRHPADLILKQIRPVSKMMILMSIRLMNIFPTIKITKVAVRRAMLGQAK